MSRKNKMTPEEAKTAKRYSDMSVETAKKYGVLADRDDRIMLDRGFVHIANSCYNRGCRPVAALAVAVTYYARCATADEMTCILSLVSAVQIDAGVPKEVFAEVFVDTSDRYALKKNLAEMDRCVREARRYA